MICYFLAMKPDLGFKIWFDHLKPRRIVIWSIRNLIVVFRIIFEMSNCSFCIFIDDPDECVDAEDVVRMIRDLEFLKNLKIRMYF